MDSQRWQQIEDLYNAVLRAPGGGSVPLCSIKPTPRCGAKSNCCWRRRILCSIGRPGRPDRNDCDAGHSPKAWPSAMRLEGQLGEGGMGVVYRALDTKLNRPVAIKFLSDEFADAAARHRFQREAQTASS